MIEVVAFEGRRHPKSSVNWGTGALSDGQWLINATTRRRTPISEFKYLLDEGHLTRLDKPVPLPDRVDSSSPFVVVEFGRGDPSTRLIAPDMGEGGGVASHGSSKDRRFYVFSNPGTFDAYCRRAAQKILERILYPGSGLESCPPDERRHLVKLGLILVSDHPGLNAVRVVDASAETRQRAEDVALRRVGAASRLHFEDLLWALRNEDIEYILKYAGGITSGGGLDVDQFARIGSNAKAIHPHFARLLPATFPYLRKPPPPRIHDMRGAASAHFHFVANVKGRPLGERVARLLELRMLERSLSGELPEGLAPEAKGAVERALGVLRSPAEGTRVSHIRLDSREESLAVGGGDATKGLERHSEPFAMLGYQVGMIREAGEVEVTLSTPWRKNQTGTMLSTTDDGNGNTPLGVEPFREGTGLALRPAVFCISHASHAGRADIKHLRDVRELAVGTTLSLTAFPSSVMRGAVLWNFEIRIHRTSEDSIDCGVLGKVNGTSDTTIPGARRWMQTFLSLCETFELDPPSIYKSRIKYWRPAKVPTVSAIQRVVVALEDLGGVAPQEAVVNQIAVRFSGHHRTNNTRRAANANPDLISYAVGDGERMQLLPKGRKLASSVRRAFALKSRKRAAAD